MRIHLDKIASVTRNLRLQRSVTLTSEIAAAEGSVIVGRILRDKGVYNQLEDVHGRMSTLHAGDVIAGALGHRRALRGYEGVLPKAVKPGDTLNVLNLGGVIGECISKNPEVGDPYEIEVLGQVLTFPDFGSRVGQPGRIQQGALQGKAAARRVPVVYIAGTCMNAGKTAAACVLVRHLSRAGLRVGGAKLTGVSLMRDILSMQDYGADVVLDFTDAGIVSTGPDTAAGVARVVLSEISAAGVDVIVAETGDGIMGEYGVQSILGDAELRALGCAFVLCANDPVGVAGGLRHMREAFQIDTDVVTGPATDNQVGVRFVESQGLRAFNARTHPQDLGALVLERVRAGGVAA